MFDLTSTEALQSYYVWILGNEVFQQFVVFSLATPHTP